MAFDGDGRLVAGEVGQNAIEEVDVVTAGANYGWRIREGTIATPGINDPAPTGPLTGPLYDYGREVGGSIIGGYVYRGGADASLEGKYVFGDFVSGGIWALSNVLAIEGRKYNIRIWTLAPGALTRMTSDLPRYKENPGAALGPDGIAPAVLYMVSDLSGDQTGKVLGVSGPRGVREMRMMEMEGWTPPFTGWKAEDIATHAKEIFFSEEEIKKSARRFK